MELDEQLKQKITERFLKRLGEPVSFVIEDIYGDLLSGDHKVNIMTRGKFTVAEVMYYRNGYNHHFLGVAAKNPKDVGNTSIGIKKSVEDALTKLLTKFYIEDIMNEGI